jgi:hypothetical protein
MHSMKPAIRSRGRPRTNALPRKEQLRLAKRAQRERDRKDGRTLCQVKLREADANLLRAGLGIPGFEDDLREFLANTIVDAEKYENLKLLRWNRSGRYLTEREAFGLYERNWRLVDTARLDEAERSLIDKLARKYGNGVLNV